MKISVIIPSYKPQEYLWECLNSLKEQTFPKEDFEIVLVLNGCKSPFDSAIEDFIKANLSGYNVNFIQTDQGGVSNARNVGLDNAVGKYVTFIDDDDYVSKSYLQELYDVAEQGFVPISNVIAFKDKEEGTIPYYISDLFQKRKNQEFCNINQVRSYFSVPVAKILLATGTVCSRRFNTKFRVGEDGAFMFLISDKIDKIKCTSDNAIYYRRKREGSAMLIQRDKAYAIKNNLKLIVEYIKIYLHNPFKYNFIFFMTRILAAIRIIIS